jgi:hypothetical protein
MWTFGLDGIELTRALIRLRPPHERSVCEPLLPCNLRSRQRVPIDRGRPSFCDSRNEAQFKSLSSDAEKNCHDSKILNATITLDAKLV